MTATALNFADDLQLAFADWGEPVVIELVTTTFDPQSLQASESVTTAEVTGIVTPVQGDRSAETAGHHVDERCSLILRAEDWPPVAVGLTRRIVFRNAGWEVLETQQPALGQPITVTLRRL